MQQTSPNHFRLIFWLVNDCWVPFWEPFWEPFPRRRYVEASWHYHIRLHMRAPVLSRMRHMKTDLVLLELRDSWGLSGHLWKRWA